MGKATVAQKKSRLFPVAFLAVKATLAALKLTNHEGGTPGFIAEGIDPAFLGLLLSQSRLSLSPAQTVRQSPITCLTIFKPIMATRLLPTALAGNISAALQARLQRTPRGRARQRPSLRCSLTSSLDLAFSRICSLIFCLCHQFVPRYVLS